MKRILTLTMLLVFSLIGISNLQAQEKLSHFALGMSFDMSSKAVNDNLTDRFKVEFKPVFTVSSAPEIYALGALNYSSLGLGGAGLGTCVKVKDFTWGKLLLGGVFVPLEFTVQTPGDQKDVALNGTGTAAGTVTVVLNQWHGMRPTFELTQESNVDMSDGAPVKEKAPRLTKIAVGIVF